jgi:hypothetical protein
MGKKEVYSFVANKRAGLISCNKRETLAHTHFTPVAHQKQENNEENTLKLR